MCRLTQLILQHIHIFFLKLLLLLLLIFFLVLILPHIHSYFPTTAYTPTHTNFPPHQYRVATLEPARHHISTTSTVGSIPFARSGHVNMSTAQSYPSHSRHDQSVRNNSSDQSTSGFANNNFPPNLLPSQPKSFQDPVGLHVVKQQLFQQSSSPFNEEPQRYHSWLNCLNNKLGGLQLTSWDKLLILEANTTGAPKKGYPKVHEPLWSRSRCNTLQNSE